LFLGDVASHIPPFRRVRHSHYIRISYGMPRFSFRPRYRTFRTPSYFWRWRGIPSCVLSPPGLPCHIIHTCKSRPYHALIFAHIIPVFGVLRGTLTTPLIVIFMRPIAVLVLPLTPPGLL
jgi:hypothetical protein